MAGEMTVAVAVHVSRAYVTFLPGADGADAVVRLAEDLRRIGVAYPLVVAALPDVVPESHRRILVSLGCVVREVEPVYPLPPSSATAAPPRYLAHYSMLRVWEFEEYERMVYMDAEIRVLANIDELFDIEEGHFYGPELGPPPPAPYFDAGTMFVHEPSAATAEALLRAVRVARPESFPQQGFLNMFFMGQYKPIPQDLNLFVRTTLAHTDENHEKAIRRTWCRLTTTAKVFARQNFPAVAALAASSAAMGVLTSAADPAACFSFYVVFITAIAALNFSLRNI